MRLVFNLFFFFWNMLFVFLQSCRFAFPFVPCRHCVEMRYSRGHFRARWTLQIVFFSISIWQIDWIQRYIKAKKLRLIYITLLCWWIKEGEQYLTNISVEWALRRCIKKYNHIWEINLLIVEMYYSIKAIQHF